MCQQPVGIEQWAYFLLNADQMTLDDVRQLFPDMEFNEAAGVLEMISKNPEQRQQYEARLKFQRDEAARLEQARNEGLEQGIELGIEQGITKGRREGTILGRITVLQELLGLTDPSLESLSSFNESQLSELAEQLKSKLRSRGE